MTESLTANVLEQHGAFVTSLARALASDAHEALDLEQETWLASLRGAPPAGESSPRRWLAGLMRGRAFSARRTARRRRAREHAGARRETVDPAAEVEAGSRVVQAVLALDEPYRTVIVLRYYQELRLADIASELDLPLETVRTRLRRAHARLRAQLDGELGGRAAWCVLLAPEAARSAAAPVAPGGWLGTGAAAAVAVGAATVLALGVGAVFGGGDAGRAEGELAARAPAEPTPESAAAGVGVDLAFAADAAAPRQAVEVDPEPAPFQGVVDAELEYWKAVAAARAAGERFDPRTHLAPETADLFNRIEATRLPGVVVLDEESLTRVLEMVTVLTGVPIEVDGGVEGAARDRGAVFDLDLSASIRLVDLLDLLVEEAGPGVLWYLAADRVRIVHAAQLDWEPITFRHPIGDFFVDPKRFFAAGVDFAPIFEPLDADDLALWVQEGVGMDAFRLAASRVAVEDGYLVVTHTARVHAQVQAHLDLLREFFIPDPARNPPGVKLARSPGGEKAQEVLTALQTTRLRPSFGAGGAGVELAEVAAFLTRVTGHGFHLTGALRASLRDDPAPVVLEGPEASVSEILDQLEEAVPRLRWGIRHGLVTLSVRHRGGGQWLALHDLRAILHEPLPLDGFVRTQLPELAASLETHGLTAVDEDALDTYLREAIDPTSWDEEPDNTLRIVGGVLVVHQRPRVLNRIDDLVLRLRRAADRR